MKKTIVFTIDEDTKKVEFSGDMPLYLMLTCIEAYHNYVFKTGTKGMLKLVAMWRNLLKAKDL